METQYVVAPRKSVRVKNGRALAGERITRNEVGPEYFRGGMDSAEAVWDRLIADGVVVPAAATQ